MNVRAAALIGGVFAFVVLALVISGPEPGSLLPSTSSLNDGGPAWVQDGEGEAQSCGLGQVGRYRVWSHDGQAQEGPVISVRICRAPLWPWAWFARRLGSLNLMASPPTPQETAESLAINELGADEHQAGCVLGSNADCRYWLAFLRYGQISAIVQLSDLIGPFELPAPDFERLVRIADGAIQSGL